MKIISHRGNIAGSVPDKENRPSYIDVAIRLGYSVEVDVRAHYGALYLGHDESQYPISKTWAQDRAEWLWFHCKNLDAVREMQNIGLKFFCHKADPYVMTSNDFIWVDDINLELNDKCIIPLISNDVPFNPNWEKAYAICTDYPEFYKMEHARRAEVRRLNPCKCNEK